MSPKVASRPSPAGVPPHPPPRISKKTYGAWLSGRRPETENEVR